MAGIGSRLGFPRTRGDGPRRSSRHRFPRTRDRARGRTRRFPRTRGDGPDPAWTASGFPAHAWTRDDSSYIHDQVSPHTRGWTGIRHGRRQLRGFPAHRGWTREILDVKRRHGFPAHAGMDPRCRCGGFPAHAGMDLGPAPFVSGFPRTPGMDLGAEAEMVSPHTRGWTPSSQVSPHTRDGPLLRPVYSGDGRGFPAHAGMDPNTTRFRPGSSGFPRTRGDGPVTVF